MGLPKNQYSLFPGLARNNMGFNLPMGQDYLDMNSYSGDSAAQGSGMPTDYSAAGFIKSNPMSMFNMTAQGPQSNTRGIFGNGPGFLGSNVMTDDLKLGIGGLQTLGNLWGGFKSLGLANKQFDFTKMMAEKNLNNQTQSYNTALEDRITSRAKAQGMSDQERQAYLSKNSLPK